MAEKRDNQKKNPFLSTISITKWKPDETVMDSVDKAIDRATDGQGKTLDEPDD